MGDQVTVEQLLVEAELDYIRKDTSSIVTPMVITNSTNSGEKNMITEETKGSAGETITITVSAT